MELYTCKSLILLNYSINIYKTAENTSNIYKTVENKSAENEIIRQ